MSTAAYELIFLMLGNVRRGRAMLIATFAVQLYEWIIGMDQELRLIHRRSWSVVKFAYLLCRYYALLLFPFLIWAWVYDHDDAVCGRFIHGIYASFVPYYASAQIVIIIRTWSFTGRRVEVLIPLVIGFCALMSAETWAFTADVFAVKSSVFLGVVPSSGCFRDSNKGAIRSPRKIALVFLGASVLDFTCTALVCVYCMQRRSIFGSLGRYFVSQGIAAFLAMSTLNLTVAGVAVWNKNIVAGNMFITILPPALANIIACRLILSIRQYAFVSEEDERIEISRVVRNALQFVNEDSSRGSSQP